MPTKKLPTWSIKSPTSAKRRFRRFLKSFIVSFFVLMAVFTLVKSSVFSIKKITCKTEFGSCGPELQGDLNKLRGRNLLFLSTAKIKNDLEGKHVVFSDFRIIKKFPNTFEVSTKGRVPVAVIKRDTRYSLIDQEGVFLGEADSSDLPTIVTNGHDEVVFQAAKIIIKLELNLFEPVEVVVLSDNSAQVLLKDNTKLLWSFKKNLDEQLDSLQLIFNRAKIEGKQIEQLDLRFNKPVAIYLNLN